MFHHRLQIFIDNMNVAWCSNEMILKKERDYDDNVGKIFRDNVTGNVEQYGKTWDHLQRLPSDIRDISDIITTKLKAGL